jgi:hypothetical protein
VFFTESQFTRQRDASKVGFVVLNCHLQRWGYVLNDGNIGPAISISRLQARAAQRIQRAAGGQLQCAGTPGGPWIVDETIDVSQWIPAAGASRLGHTVTL